MSSERRYEDTPLGRQCTWCDGAPAEHIPSTGNCPDMRFTFDRATRLAAAARAEGAVEALREAADSLERQRPSYSGPLVAGAGWLRARASAVGSDRADSLSTDATTGDANV